MELQSGLAWHSLLEACWLFSQKSHYHEWKLGCAWKVHVQQEENLASKAYCVSLNAQNLLYLSDSVSRLFLFFNTDCCTDWSMAGALLFCVLTPPDCCLSVQVRLLSRPPQELNLHLPVYEQRKYTCVEKCEKQDIRPVHTVWPDLLQYISMLSLATHAHTQTQQTRTSLSLFVWDSAVLSFYPLFGLFRWPFLQTLKNLDSNVQVHSSDAPKCLLKLATFPQWWSEIDNSWTDGGVLHLSTYWYQSHF